MLTNSPGANYVLNEHEGFDQHGPYATPSEIMQCYSYTASVVDQNEIPFDLSY